MTIRPAGPQDAAQIARLHADSWRRTYRGLFSDRFLDHDAETDRLSTWTARLNTVRDNQGVFVAEGGMGRIRGFICVYGAEDTGWGSLVDNLHVGHASRGRGIGCRLMGRAFSWLTRFYPDSGVYLWVMQSNNKAREFYSRRGAREAGCVDRPNPAGGGSAFNCRYVWDDPARLSLPSADRRN